MDPYQILGIEENAPPEEIKRAYRREAMRWHPDRNHDSGTAKERFHDAAQAYKILSERTPGRNDNRSHARSDNKPRGHGEKQAGDRHDSRNTENDSQDEFADSVFWDVMLDYAIKLAQTGLSEIEIEIDIRRNGCPERIAKVIADKAFNIHAHYASGPGSKRKARPDRSTFREERLETDLFRAFLGQRSLVWSPRDTIEYYLVTFAEFRQSVKTNPLSWINVNKRLMRIFNFSIILFTLIAVAISFFPGPSKYKLLSDMAMLQLPLSILPLMLVWMLFRKLWVPTLVFSLIYLSVIAFFNSSMPQSPSRDPVSSLMVAAACFAPFVFIAMFANFLYYRKARRLIHQARNLFTDHLDQMVWIKNRAGTSSTAAFMFILFMVSSMTYLAPRSWDYSSPFSFDSPFAAIEKDDSRLKKIRTQSIEAGELFEIAESHFHGSPPDHVKALMAYSTAADNGSLLAAYKLGYMYYAGEGGERDEAMAFEYFQLATRVPLAYQPHNLRLTTRFLAESYNNLGIMYQHGIGTRRNLKQASGMYNRAIEFGSSGARSNLKKVYKSKTGAKPESLVYPEYK